MSRHALVVLAASLADTLEHALPGIGDADLEELRRELQRAHDTAGGELLRREVLADEVDA